MNYICSGAGIGDAVTSLYAAQAIAVTQPVNFFTRHPEWFSDVEDIKVNSYIEALQHPIAGNFYRDDRYNFELYGRGMPRKECYLHNVKMGHLRPAAPKLKRYWNAYESIKIAISPFAAWAERQWPLERWLAVIQYLESLGLEPIVIGSSHNDFSQLPCKAVQGETPSAVIDTLLQCALFIGNDSGMAHIAAMYRMPVLVVMDTAVGFEHVFSYTNAQNAAALPALAQISADTVIHALQKCDAVKRALKAQVNPDFLKTYEVKATKARLGSPNDGGYVVVTSIGEYDALISCGIGNDTNFEREFLAAYPVPAFLYDHTVADPQVPGAQFFPVEIGAEETLNALAQNYSNIFLKMGIEDGEWAWLQHFQHPERLKQIVIEIHGTLNLEKRSLLTKLLETHTIVHAHGNNYASTYVTSGITLPRVMELTLLRKDVTAITNLQVNKLPTIWDTPNNPSAPEITLGYPFSSGISDIAQRAKLQII